MSYKKIFFPAMTALLLLASCGKTSTGPTAEKSSWTFNGATYNEGTAATTYSLSNNLTATDNSNASVTVQFYSKPTIPGSLAITDLSDTSVLISTNCIIYATTPANAHYTSTGNGGHFVSIAIGTAGKLTASFSNVEMKNNSTFDTENLSGTLIER